MASSSRPECPGFFEKDLDNDKLAIYRNREHGVGVIPDIRPAALGHTLTVPFECKPTVDDLPRTRFEKLHLVAQYAGLRLRELFGSSDTYIAEAVAGNQVPHAHIHRFPADGDGQAWASFAGREPRLKLGWDEIDAMAREIRFPSHMAAELDAELSAISPPEFPVGLRRLGQMAVDLNPQNNL